MPAAEPDLHDALAVALEAAGAAIALVHEMPLGAVAAKSGDADLVTEVDTAVERAVRELIARRLPGHTVVGEELGGVAGAGPTWYCDPVDGTTNLVAGLPWTSFSLALAVGPTPLVAVVADPWRGEVLHAVRDGGCFVDGARVPAGRAPFRSRLRGGVVLTEWVGHRPWPGMEALMAALADLGCTPRIMGSGTLALAHVAAGRATGAVIGEFRPEDHLAALLLCAEAGLDVRDRTGARRLFPRDGGVMVCAPAAADALFALWCGGR